MRLWHYELLPYLPELQFKGQLRELVAIMHDWRDKGHTNHLLINMVMEYPKNDFARYFVYYEANYRKRYGEQLTKQWEEFKAFDDTPLDKRSKGVFTGWHNKEYLRVCVCNLYEKYHFGVGKSKISQEEWDRVLQGYKEITGEDWVL
jgi:uncharacterized protein (TIGR02328 family)